jgi:hypothetical protein
MSLLYNYILFDAARAEMELYSAIELNSNYQSLYKGSAEEELAGIAPYIFTIKENTTFSDWYFAYGWNNSWGTLLFANAAFDDVYRHFRRFLMVKTEDGQQLYFRFYDPRVLRIFLPTADSSQLKEIFGPVRHFITESENPNEALQFWLENGILKTKTIPFTPNSPVAQSQIEEANEDNAIVEQKPIIEEKPSDENYEIEKSAAEKPKKKWNFYRED